MAAEVAAAAYVESTTVKATRRSFSSINRSSSSGSSIISNSSSSSSRSSSHSSRANATVKIACRTSTIIIIISSNSSINRSTSINSGTSDSSPRSVQGDGVHHVFVLGVVSPGISCPISAQCPLHHRTCVFPTRMRECNLLPIRRLEPTPTLGADLQHHHHSQPPPRRTYMDRRFCPSYPGATSQTGPPWRNLRHQVNRVYRVQVW